MSNTFNRMKSLLQGTGISFNDGGISDAEIYAYASAVDFIMQKLQCSIDDVFMENGSTAEKYAALLNLDKNRYTAEHLKQEIKKRLAMSYASATVTEHDAAFDAVGSGSYELLLSQNENVPTIVFSGVALEDLPQLAKFIESYTCPGEEAYYDGDGLTFDEWDSLNKSFYSLDKMNLPFNIIDYLRSDIIE